MTRKSPVTRRESLLSALAIHLLNMGCPITTALIRLSTFDFLNWQASDMFVSDNPATKELPQRITGQVGNGRQPEVLTVFRMVGTLCPTRTLDCEPMNPRKRGHYDATDIKLFYRRDNCHSYCCLIGFFSIFSGIGGVIRVVRRLMRKSLPHWVKRLLVGLKKSASTYLLTAFFTIHRRQ